jgi:mRNA-degrading endonuclease toxin of MazEF toxin-antitoxin module
VFVVVSRNGFLATAHGAVSVAPVYSRGEGLLTEVPVGPESGLKHDSFIRCDEVTGLRRSMLRDYVGSLSDGKLSQLNRALAIALAITAADLADL